MQTVETIPKFNVPWNKLSDKITYEDYKEIPDNGKRYQIVDGELTMSSAPNMFHQHVSLNLTYYLKDFLLKHPIGVLYEAPCDVVLSDIDIVQPDILFVLNEHKSIITNENVTGAPDFVIEIISGSSRRLDIKVKKVLYELHNVKEYWIVDPDLDTIQKLLLQDKKFVDTGTYEINQTIFSDVIKGFSIELEKVFAH